MLLSEFKAIQVGYTKVFVWRGYTTKKVVGLVVDIQERESGQWPYIDRCQVLWQHNNRRGWYPYYDIYIYTNKKTGHSGQV